jgi:hypothetical protein
MHDRIPELRPLHLPRRGLPPFYPDWDGAADICVSILRTEAGRDPFDNFMHDLVDELSTRSEDFRRRWSAHDVRAHGAGLKYFHHQVVGNLELAYESVGHGFRTPTNAHLLRRGACLPNCACPRPTGVLDGQPDGGPSPDRLTSTSAAALMKPEVGVGIRFAYGHMITGRSRTIHSPTAFRSVEVQDVNRVAHGGSGITWRTAMPLIASVQNSHRDGGRVFLIFVADPRPASVQHFASRVAGQSG